MRPLLVLVIIILFIASAYYDLQVGTIPYNNPVDDKHENEEGDRNEINNETSDQETEVREIPYVEVIVEAGQTVYEIVRKMNEENGFVESPHKVIADFEALNPNISAHEIIIGHTYRFPLYPSP